MQFFHALGFSLLPMVFSFKLERDRAKTHFLKIDSSSKQTVYDNTQLLKYCDCEIHSVNMDC